MSQLIKLSVIGLSALLIAAPASRAAQPGVRDGAHMLSEEAARSVNEKLRAAHKAHGWEIVFETVDTLGGRPADELARESAAALGVKGVHVLVAKDERHITVQVHRKAEPVFGNVGDTLTKTMTSAFRQNQFDRGFLEGADYLAQVAARGQAGVPAAARHQTVAEDRADGSGSFLVTALVIGALVVGGLLLVRALSRPAAVPGSGGGYPGGGGFLSSLMGSLGGVFLGSWLYNSFFGSQAHAAEHPGELPAQPDAETGAGDQYREAGSAGWDEPSSGGETDTGGFDDGGDAGGFDGGDFGDAGGGDW